MYKSKSVNFIFVFILETQQLHIEILIVETKNNFLINFKQLFFFGLS